MICTFCGTENREGNKFCGICGVRLERRKVDRRAQSDAAYLKCGSCGHGNDEGYKFCGMCGARIDRRVAERRGSGISVRAENALGGGVMVAAPPEPRISAAQGVPLQRERGSESPLRGEAAAVPPRSGAEAFHRERGDNSAIFGPSFLGLSDESEDETSYLMEDEASSGSGLRKLVLLVILAAIVGLIFVQYRSSLHANPKAAPPAQPSPAPQGQTPPAPATLPNQSQAPASAPSQPNEQNAVPGVADPGPTAPQQNAAPAAQVSPASETTLLPQLDPPDDGKATDTPDPANNKKADSSSAGKNFDAPVPAEQKPSQLLVRAQQFLHGQGVEQNCEQGLLYLRAAAQKNEPAAAVQMGALYASGRCVHQDRVMAYRWFNSAHELEPANQWIQKNMDLLWGQMNEQERRLAGY